MLTNDYTCASIEGVNHADGKPASHKSTMNARFVHTSLSLSLSHNKPPFPNLIRERCENQVLNYPVKDGKELLNRTRDR